MGTIPPKQPFSYADIVKKSSTSAPIPIPVNKQKNQTSMLQNTQSAFDDFSFNSNNKANKNISSKSIDELNIRTSSIDLEDTDADNLSINSPASSYSSYNENWWNDRKEDSTINSTSTISSYSDKSNLNQLKENASYAQMASLKRPKMYKSHSAFNLNPTTAKQESWKKKTPLSTSYATGSSFVDDWGTIAERYNLNNKDKSGFRDTDSMRSVRSMRSVSSLTSIHSNLSYTGSITDDDYHNIIEQIKEDRRSEQETGKIVFPPAFNNDQQKTARETLKYVRRLDKQKIYEQYGMKHELEWILRLAWRTPPGKDNVFYCPTSRDIDNALAAFKAAKDGKFSAGKHWLLRILQRGVAKQAKETLESISKTSFPNKSKELSTNIFYDILSAEHGSTLAPISIASAPYNNSSQRVYFPVKNGGTLLTAYASTPEIETEKDENKNIHPSKRKQFIGRTRTEVMAEYNVDITANNSLSDFKKKFKSFFDKAINWNGTKWNAGR
jgi:hypothetical protein